MIGKTNHWIWLVCVCLPLPVSAADVSPLPDPLSLEQALQSIDENHPVLLNARLDGQYAKADLLTTNANNSVRVDLDGRLRWTESNVDLPITDDSKDHQLTLIVSKPIYDGGLTVANQRAAESSGVSADIEYSYEKDRYTITVMQRFFNIVLADLEASRDTEAMATAFVQMDRAEDNHDLGRISDIDLLELQSAYQKSRVKVYNSDGNARKTRQLLALALNRPGQQPSQITVPALDVSGRVLLGYDELLDKVLSGNPRLTAMNHSIEAARSRITAAKSGNKPKVTALLERAEQSRVTATDDKWRVGVEWTMPIYDGGVSDAAVRRAHLDLNQRTYQRQQYELELRAQVRELTEKFRVLNAEKDSNLVFADYRELYMDRSRALYDLEVKTDLGDAMIQISEAHLRDARQRFELSLLLAQLNLLAGEPIMQWGALTNKNTQPTGRGL